MDAVCFVVGLHTKELRGKQLKDLIYRCTTDKGDGVSSSHQSATRWRARRPGASWPAARDSPRRPLTPRDSHRPLQRSGARR